MFRAIRQGCPVSALLFILCMKMLAKKVIYSKLLVGFDNGYPQKPIKIQQHADDAFSLNDRTEMCSALSILCDFG